MLQLSLLAFFAASVPLDVPLTVEESAGVQRVAEPVTFGVPLPKGLARDTESFQWQTDEGQVTDRLKLFGQLFRNSQRLPWYLSVEARPVPDR